MPMEHLEKPLTEAQIDALLQHDTHDVAVNFFLSFLFREPADAYGLWKRCGERACRRQKACGFDPFDGTLPPPCAAHWSGETGKGALMMQVGFLRGIETAVAFMTHDPDEPATARLARWARSLRAQEKEDAEADAEAPW